MSTPGNRVPRGARATGRPGNRVQSESLDRTSVQATTGALRVEAASQADATAAAIDAAVPSNLQARLDDYEQRITDLESTSTP